MFGIAIISICQLHHIIIMIIASRQLRGIEFAASATFIEYQLVTINYSYIHTLLASRIIQNNIFTQWFKMQLCNYIASQTYFTEAVPHITADTCTYITSHTCHPIYHYLASQLVLPIQGKVQPQYLFKVVYTQSHIHKDKTVISAPVFNNLTFRLPQFC